MTKFRAFDTETVNRPGHGEACLLILQAPDGVKTYESPSTFSQVFSFLASRPISTLVAYNMDFDSRAIIHPGLLPWKVCEALGLYGRARWGRFTFRYTPAKFLEVRDASKRGFILYDLKQFFGMGLAAALEKHFPALPKHKIPQHWYNEIDKCLQDSRREKVLSYAIRDVEGTQALCDLLMSSLSALGMAPRRLSSCASLARLRYGRVLARVRALDYVNSIFERGFFGGRIEVNALGRIGPCKLYDINSAYPSVLATLKDPSKGTHTRSVGVSWKFSRLPDYGVYFAEISVPLDWNFGPFAVRDRGQVFYPVGRVRTYIGSAGLALVRRLRLPHKIRYAYEIHDCPPEPLFPDMADMYARRKGSDVGLAIKLTINSLYGLTAESTNYLTESIEGEREIGGRWIQTRRRYGKLTNFCMASHITEAVRLRLWEAARNLKNPPHFMATDSLLVSESDEIPTGPGLGEWSLKGGYKNAVVLGCGRYMLEGEKTEYHLRGFPVRPEIFTRLSKSRQSRVRIKTLDTKSLRQWAVDSFSEDLNVLSPTWRFLEVRDDKRHWPKTFPLLSDYFQDKISSLPYIVGRPEELHHGK